MALHSINFSSRHPHMLHAGLCLFFALASLTSQSVLASTTYDTDGESSRLIAVVHKQIQTDAPAGRYITREHPHTKGSQQMSPEEETYDTRHQHNSGVISRELAMTSRKIDIHKGRMLAGRAPRAPPTAPKPPLSYGCNPV